MVRGSLVWVSLDPRPRLRGTRNPAVHCCFANRSQRHLFNSSDRSTFFGSRKTRRPLVQPLLSAKETELPKDSRALCDQVRTIDKGGIRSTIGGLSDTLLGKVDAD
jgi:mRNA-degrading endonuclease toxin of MazEF toxin-antitoxin module